MTFTGRWVVVVSQRIDVAPFVMAWARTSLNLPVEVAARKLGVTAETLQRWESGDLMPTIVQLRKAAKVFGRPLAVLLLDEPPVDFSVPRDFRKHTVDPTPDLIAEIRRAHEQSDVMGEIAEQRPDLVPEPANLPRARSSDDPEIIGDRVRAFLDVSLATQQSWSKSGEALSGWIAAAEDAGVLVIQTSGVSLDETLGFSLHTEPYPVVALNGSDWASRRTFTLMHELAHLSLGRGGLCDLHDEESPTDDTEALCNRVAAAVLLPRAAVLDATLAASLPAGEEWSTGDVARLAGVFNVSRESALLRLISVGLASWADYERVKPVLDEELAEIIADQQDRLKESDGGPGYYVLKSRNLGHSYTSTVLNAYHDDAISPVDVATFLQIRFQQLGDLEAVA